MELSGKTILVTGASGALGSELTNVLSSRGAKVLGTATTNESAGRISAKAEVKLLLEFDSDLD
jgi:NAD(P)-dependent dehydrogenase (short-subunit alcohol dehydrogenase family)